MLSRRESPSADRGRLSGIGRQQAAVPDTLRELLPDDIADRLRFACIPFFVLHASNRQAIRWQP
jgi:hypothetical protein